MARNDRGDRPMSWPARMLQEHARVFFFSLGKLWVNPFGSLLTAVVIGITLSLPAGLHVMLGNLGGLSSSWEGAMQVSLFLKDSVSEERGQALAREIKLRPGVSQAAYISKDDALSEFRKLSGFGEALDTLDSNPLPAVITVTPSATQTEKQVDGLYDALSKLPEVDLAKIDQKWLERLYAIIQIVQRGVMVVASLLGLAVIVTVGNIVRLDIQGRHEEIEVMKLIGAPNSFIRRPFLYTGFWYGLSGGIVAILFVWIGILALEAPVTHLAGLYQSKYGLAGPGFLSCMEILGCGILLGWLGAFWTVARHIHAIEPR
jgi:cell division transport system permease protein